MRVKLIKLSLCNFSLYDTLESNEINAHFQKFMQKIKVYNYCHVKFSIAMSS